MPEPSFKRIICSHTKDQCPYQLEHCWLGEINVKSLNNKEPVIGRLPCRIKKSRKVICILDAA